MAKKIKINEYLDGEYYNPYCETCGTCGYIGSNFWNKGRTQEIKERVIHLDNKDTEDC